MRWEDAVIVALGSNLPSPSGSSSRSVIENALDAFPGVVGIVKAKSSLWRSASWPDPTAPDYLNAVAILQTSIAPRALLRQLEALERSFGRERTFANAPRTLDLDLIAYGRLVLADPELLLPHPRAAERLFVMGPLAEVAPDWIHPVTGTRADDLARSARVGRDATTLD